jgi:hypothetical protein
MGIVFDFWDCQMSQIKRDPRFLVLMNNVPDMRDGIL